MHRLDCPYTEKGPLRPECPECKNLILHPELLDERFEHHKELASGNCRYCNHRITLGISGLYPLGISVRCKCY